MEQVIKLFGRIAEILPAQTGTSMRTGEEWTSQDYVFEYYKWSGQQYASRICARIFGKENIAKHNLRQFEEVWLTLDISARRNQDGTRWFNEVRIIAVEREMAQQSAAATEDNGHKFPAY